MTWPCPGAMALSRGRIVFSRSSDARYVAMSPSGGLMTTVDPCMMWSPVNSVRSSLSR